MGQAKIDLELGCQLRMARATGDPACWPSRGKSRRLSLTHLAFPFRNYGFAVFLGVIYWLMIWMFATTQVNGRWPARP